MAKSIFLQTLALPFSALWSMIQGLSVTGHWLCRRKITVRYPRAVVPQDLLSSYRGPLELVGLDQDPAVPRCISCLLCVQACPSGCISIVKAKPPPISPKEQQAMDQAAARGEKIKKPAAPKTPAAWVYDFSLCSLCGCCVDACPAQAIRFSNEIYISAFRRDEIRYNLLARLKRKAGPAVFPAQADKPGKGDLHDQ